MTIEMAPSILSADFMNLERDVVAINNGGADWIHFDVMDGHFVPNLTLGVPFVRAMKKISTSPLDVHLMISNPEVQVPWYLEAGADLVTIHIETTDNPKTLLQSIRQAGAKCGISLNPETSVEAIADVLGDVDVVLVMSVHPGFGGQSFIEECVDKTKAICAMCKEQGVNPVIEIDGGINEQTVKLAARAGATMIVAGSAVFAKSDPVFAMNAIRQSAEEVIG